MDARPLTTFIAIVVVTLVFLGLIIVTWSSFGDPFTASTLKSRENLEMTGTMARLSGNDPLQTAVAYSQTIYAAAQDKDRPGAVVLVRDDDPATAIATTRLQHFPVNAPMLFVTGNGTRVPEVTMRELERLDPEGVMMDNNVQVYLAGNISEDIAMQIRDRLGYTVRRLYADDPVTYTEVLDEFLAVMESNHPDIVLVASTEALEYAYPAANWNAHMGRGFAFVTPEGVPDETKRILERSWPNYPYIYVFAPESIVGQDVMAEFSRYGHVQRIPGETPQEMAVRWAGYKDSGLKVTWWVSFRPRAVGWGYAEPGHNILLGTPDDWRVVVPSGVLSHMGKHAFLILTGPDGTLPDVARSYLEVLKPTRTYPNQQVFNYGWVLGQEVPDRAMQEVSELLSVANASPE
ncbi:cell wall-binding repeat 2 family protein [Methanoculleus sp. FWC-SCC1]|uniref:Cell wall-binding repeat 2 family protein n=1 Tax=Methanoculleus frigidifontis TaxID=2584085 RepID=A0ABT8M8K9_9EURY|nr:hypothetical protein [Methanoculleus sp. FWC-SCC1]MDN7024266.1 cell wall-binding repeat 2 family protein [Methanoculleus sp. FWC-SCC1]